MSGRSTTGSNSLGTALVAGRKRVPKPATGKTALRTRLLVMLSSKPGGKPVGFDQCLDRLAFAHDRPFSPVYHRFGHQPARIIGICHGCAISAGGHESD